MSATSSNALIGTVALFALLAVTPACGAWFGCGCDWPWRGMFVHCASILGLPPACPWCENPALGLASLVLPVMGGVGLVRLGGYCRRRPEGLGLPGFVLAVALGMFGALAALGSLGALTPLLQRMIPF